MQEIISTVPKYTKTHLKNLGKVTGSFKIITHLADHDNPRDDPFLVSTIRGFLPRKDPIIVTPPQFDVVDSLLKRMRWNQPDGSRGLLAKNIFGETINRELTEINFDGFDDTMKEIALYRDYSYLASAYLLENCHHTWLRTGNSYGLGRDHLPKSIAKPLVKLATKLNFHPFLEYNSGYTLNNWYRIDKTKEIALHNIDVGRSFINMKAESGFILLHVTINEHSGRLIQSGIEVLNAVEQNDREAFNEALTYMKNVMVYVNLEFTKMYYESNPEHYNNFRTFVMGILNQPMFPNGVVYEDCFDNKPQFYRGESCANDSIIPFCDNILQITQYLPKNFLTEILRNFRLCRPKEHQEFLTWTEKVSKRLGVLEFARQNPESMVLLLEVADQVRAFRYTHWILTNIYIIRKSCHPVATGGSPITTWLPNQLLAVIDFIKYNSKYAIEGEIPSNLQYSLDAILTKTDSDEIIVKRQTEESRKQFKQ